MYEAAVRAGAPEGCIGWLTNVTLEATQHLMSHEDTAVILATGGAGLVKAAYSSGKPAYGVGPGNCPAYIERSADIRHAVTVIVASQTFDNGVICAAEQSVITEECIEEKVRAEFLAQGGYFLNADETKKLEKIVMRGKGVNPDIVGQFPRKLAEMAGFSVPHDTTVLLAPYEGVGYDYPLSIEKMTPILAYYTVKDWQEACQLCIRLVTFGGMGHSLAIHSNNDDVINEFAMKKPAFRLLVNAPTSQGAIGYATGLIPSLTLGCGTYGSNITSDNVSTLNLINVKRLAYIKEGWLEEYQAQLQKGYASQKTVFHYGESGMSGGSNPGSKDFQAKTPVQNSAPRPGSAALRKTPLGDAVTPLTPKDIEAIISKHRSS
jgi:acetaldehyde dehydrogenase (acetylating)